MGEVIKLVVAVPTSGMNPASFTFSYGCMMASFSSGLPSRRNAELQVMQDGQISSCILSNREQLVRRAIDNGQTHLLFLDHDMKFDPRVVDCLFARRHPIVVTNYLIKTYDPTLAMPTEKSEFVAVDLDGRRVPLLPSSTGLQEISYSGFGVSLFETRVFKETPQPWFQPKFVPESNSYTTEDLPCFERLRAAGFTVYLDHDASKMVSHVGEYEWTWQNWVPPSKRTKTEALKIVKDEVA